MLSNIRNQIDNISCHNIIIVYCSSEDYVSIFLLSVKLSGHFVCIVIVTCIM